ncbi:multicopper oxidase domain-containing protein [Acinetobacter sp. SM34]|uniref:multicopper oxidase domain-containing protein n=1 Tax=Acinetobacter sp. SM34 TaxID=1301620 RepID=UPI001ED9E2A2|nr:multicopper oxidase domain-containing protein [Acinetobacter sp. SM34]MCG2609621.1 multicopper oxidase domain-containing protein [Acinetobacter sp. SM34]
MSIQLSQSLVIGVCLVSSSWAFAAVKEYHLNIDEQSVNITGKSLKRITVNGQFPAPLLEFEEGDDAVIHVHNNLKNKDSSIHWHGLLLPGLMDGVPGFNQFKGIKPQADFVYRFKVRQNGTYWYHSHSKGQEQDGLYGALVIYPQGKKPLAAHEQADRDYVVMLSDFHQSGSAQILKNLKKSAEYYQNRRETVADVLRQVQRDGLKSTWQDRTMWNQMRMLKTDLSDVTGYTFLINGKTPEQNWTGMFKPNEKVRLRFINASAMTFYDVRIPDLKMTVVSADGQPVQPVPVDEFRIGNAETYDVIVEPKANHYQIEAESIDRSGFAIGTLHNENSPVTHAIHMPKPRPRALLTMEDMGHGSASSDHANHAQMDDHQSSTNQSSAGSMKHQTMDHSSMQHDSTVMDYQQMDLMQHDSTAMNHQAMEHMHMNHAAMQEHSQHATQQHAMPQPAKPESEQQQTHASHSAVTPSVDHKAPVVYGWANASTPAGHKALQYSDLKSLTPQPDTRPAERELEVRLGGNMERYIWTINGKKFTEVEPLQVKYGERIRLKFINDSMMAHPMHLHGMFMQLENGQSSANMPNKHTLIVPPGKTVTALLTADEVGEWAIHCHLLYHMSSGMMSKLVVANVDGNKMLASPATPAQVEQGDSHAHH